MKYLLLLSILLIGCRNNSNKEGADKIRVTGEGKIRVKPDLVTLTIKVSFVQAKMVDAVSMTQRTVDSVLNILNQFKSQASDIKTSSISANKEYNYTGRAPVFSGFRAEESLEFILNDIEKFTQLSGRLLGTKINSISQIKFGHSKADSLYREADLLAYDDALKSASKLCKRANATLGKLLFVSNAQGISNSYADYTDNEINTYSKGYGGPGFVISPEVLEFKRNIISEFEIVQ